MVSDAAAESELGGAAWLDALVWLTLRKAAK